MIEIAFALAAIALMLVVIEILWRKRYLEREAGRKIVHVLVGVWVSLWPLFLTFSEIRFLGIAMLIVILISKRLEIFQSIHNVTRTTVGEILFPLAVILATFLTDSPWIFAAAILELGIADGLAAVVGGRSKRTTFHFFEQRKSISGSLAFLGVSILIISAVSYNHGVSALAIGLIALTVTIAELVSPFGLDDLAVPLLTILLLGSVV